ncbi:uncharacterized protein YMR317W-like [Arvicola amphibius]|uniref:uncharacterized protein YMR317W-like n=1 Tax=Arvicola amphibius TaxID=1047088 RepID=UPI001C0A38F5|nr:uncharacterized protein YMR317W-like [Arvicola amphibius]
MLLLFSLDVLGRRLGGRALGGKEDMVGGVFIFAAVVISVGGSSFWVLASDSSSTKSSVHNRNLPCTSTCSSLPHSTKGYDSTEEPKSSSVTETPTSKSQDQMTSPTLPTLPQSRGTAGPTEQMTSTIHTPAMTVTNSMSLSDSTMTPVVKESIGTSKTTVLFSLAISAETPQLNQIPPSLTPDKVRDTHEPLPTTTMAATNTPSPTTAFPGTTVLSTAIAETQEKDTAAVPPTSATPPTTSKPPDTQHNIAAQTPSQSAQLTSDAGMTLDTTPSPPKSTSTGMGSPVSPSSGDTDRTMTTPSMALNTKSTPEDTIPTSRTGIPTAPEKSALTPPSSTLDKARDTHEPLPTTTMAATHTPSSTTASPRTTVLSTAIAETQEKDTAAVPPTPVTLPTTSKLPDPQHSSVTQTPSQPAQTGSSIGTGTAQSPEHPTGLVHNASETTKSSTIIGTSPAPPNSSQSSGPGGGACALDEYLDSTRGCMCNSSYYFHSELSREIGTLRCKAEVIEMALRSCFLNHHHLVLKKDVFSGCSSINTIDQDHRVQVFQLEKKEGTCGLHISTNISHALHSVNVHLEETHPGSGSRVLRFSCAYPLVVNVSKPVSYQEASIPTIHVPGTGETVITLSVFTDLHLHSPLQDSTAPVGMPLYVVLKSTSSDPDRFTLVANEVFASSNLSNTVAKATYHFVNESCPVGDRLLQDLNNGASVQVTLAFTLSRFLNSDTLYLHAQVTLCDKQASSPCQPSCSGKNSLRRNSPWDSRVGTHLEPGGSKWIIFGPLQISEPRASSSRSRAGAWMSILLLMVTGWMLG